MIRPHIQTIRTVQYHTAKEGAVEYKCLILNLIYSQTKYEIDYKD